MRTISYKVSYEKMISRLPAMFAYLDIDEQGTCEIVKATNGKQGDYGRIIANVYYDKNIVDKDKNEEKPFEHECKDGTKLKITNGEKTYRTLIETYYKAIKDKEWERNEDGTYDNPFLAFMEKGIGLKYVGWSEEVSKNEECRGVPTLKKFPLAPDYIYLGEAKTLYNKMVQMKKQLIFWEEHTKLCTEDKKYYQRLKEEFEMRNGNKLIDELPKLIEEAEKVATEYLGYTSYINDLGERKNTNLTLDFNVNLVNTIKDLGLVTPYIEEWVAGKRYYEEDVVYHIDGNGYGMTWYCKPSEKAKKDEFGRPYTEGFYEENTELIFFDDGSTITIGGKEIETPKNWIPQSLNWVKRNERFICKNCGEVYEDDGTCKCGNEKLTKFYKYYKYVGKQEGTKVIEGTCNSHLTSLRRFATYLNRNDEVETPDNYTDWLWYYRKGMVMNREEKYDEMGNLAVMYGKEEGYADGVEAIVGGDKRTNIKTDPNDDKTVINLAAWGDVITDISAENDRADGGTITFTYWLGVHLKAKKDNRYVVNSPFVGIFDNNGNKDKIQFSRGDIITQEKYEKIDNAEEAKEYCDEMKWYSQDDDGNYKYYFKDFEADTTSPYGANHGVKYTETYIYYKGDTSYEVIKRFISGEDYEEGDIIPYDKYKELSVDDKKKCKPVEETIWSLRDSGKEKFDAYINGEFDREYKPDGMTEEDADAPYYYRLYDKMEFYTGDNIYSYNIRIGNRINKVPFLRTNFTTTVDIKHVDIEERPLIRYDYYNGVSFQPSVNEDVYVERGVTQAFEKHIKFSEIKTFEDLENYANGGFFVISKEDIDLG